MLVINTRALANSFQTHALATLEPAPRAALPPAGSELPAVEGDRPLETRKSHFPARAWSPQPGCSGQVSGSGGRGTGSTLLLGEMLPPAGTPQREPAPHHRPAAPHPGPPVAQVSTLWHVWCLECPSRPMLVVLQPCPPGRPPPQVFPAAHPVDRPRPLPPTWTAPPRAASPRPSSSAPRYTSPAAAAAQVGPSPSRGPRLHQDEVGVIVVQGAEGAQARLRCPRDSAQGGP